MLKFTILCHSSMLGLENEVNEWITLQGSYLTIHQMSYSSTAETENNYSCNSVAIVYDCPRFDADGNVIREKGFKDV